MNIDEIDADINIKPIAQFHRPDRIPSASRPLTPIKAIRTAKLNLLSDSYHQFSIELPSTTKNNSKHLKLLQATNSPLENSDGFTNTKITTAESTITHIILQKSPGKKSDSKEMMRKNSSHKTLSHIEWCEATTDFKKTVKEEINYEKIYGISAQKAFILLQEDMASHTNYKQLIESKSISFFECSKSRRCSYQLEKEKNILLDLRFIEFNYKNPIHSKITNSIYFIMTNTINYMNTIAGTPFDKITNCGIIYALQLLYFAQELPKECSYASRTRGFDEMIAISRTCTDISINALIAHKLKELCSRYESCFKATNAFYCSCVLEFLNEKHQLDKYDKYCIKNVKKLVIKYSNSKQ